MTHYVKHPIHFTDSQMKTFGSAVTKHEPHSIKLSHKELSASPNMEVLLTKTQAHKLAKSHKMGKGAAIHFSAAQMKKMNQMQAGGFLPALAAVLPVLGEIASIVGPALLGGAAAGLGSWGIGQIADKVSGNGLYTLGNPGTYGAGMYPLGPLGMAMHWPGINYGAGYAQMGNVGYPHVPAPIGSYDLLPPHQYDAPLELPPNVFHQTTPAHAQFVDSATPAGVPLAIKKKPKKQKKSSAGM